MVAKSVFEIDIQDERFQQFLESYNTYQEKLAAMPAMWRAVGDSAAKATEPLSDAADNSTSMARAFQSVVDTNQKLLVSMDSVASNTATIANNAKNLNRETGGAKRFLDGSAKAAKSMAGDIKDATLSLLKWGSILGVFSGLVGGGGLFGINRLSDSASRTRFTALGIGTTAGGLDASAVNYQKALANPVATLGNIRDAQSDLSRRWAFDAMGIQNASRTDPAKLLPEMIKQARDIFTRSGSTLQGAEAHGLTQFFTIDDLNRFQRMSNAEIDGMAKRAEADARQMQVSDELLRKWQDFNVQLDRSGVNIRNAFINGLTPLVPQLEKLSQGVADFITAILRSPQFGQWIDAAAEGLERFGNYLVSPEFEDKAKEFMRVLGELIHGVGVVATWFASKFGGDTPAAPGDTAKPPGLRLAPSILGPDTQAYLTPGGLSINGQQGHRTPYGNWVMDPLTNAISMGGGNLVRQREAQRDKATGGGWLKFLYDRAQKNMMDAEQWDSPLKGPGKGDTIAQRFNNPLNIRKWKSKEFRQFDTVDDGFRAAAEQLKRYGNGKTFGKPVNTIHDIISNWAPKKDGNDTEGYIKYVVANTPYAENQKLDLNDNQTLAKLIAAMSRKEDSSSRYSTGRIQVAIQNNTGGNAVVSGAQIAGN